MAGSHKGYLTTFRHRDNRIWQVSITLCDQPIEVEEDGGGVFTHLVECTSAGCRPILFAAESVRDAQRTVDRFANTNSERYERLVADAQGTTDHPRSGDIGVFVINVVRETKRHDNRREVHRSTLNGIGRVNAFQLTIFPTSEELAHILTRIATPGVRAIVPQGINQLRDTNTPLGFGMAHRDFSNADTPEVVIDEVDEALMRLFAATSTAALAGLSSGDFAMGPRGREDRVIDLG